MADKLSEVGKSLGQTKRNAETALRRYQAKHPKIERVRDIFDDVVPFEMEFETRQEETIFSMSLDFNKPPPMNNCREGNYVMNCDKFTSSSGQNLFNIGQSYFPNTVTVYADGILLDRSEYAEYSPPEGLVYVVNRAEGQIISICYVAISWKRICDPTLDPLEGSTNVTGGIFESYSPSTPVGAGVDNDPTTQTPTFDHDSTVQAEFEAQIAERSGIIWWSTHLGDLANLTPGHPDFAAQGNMIWPERDGINIDWNEIHAGFQAEVRTGTWFGQYLGFFPQASESTFAQFDIGYGDTVSIEVTMRHDYRGGFFPFLGPPQGPEGFFRVINWGNAYDENETFIDSGGTASDYYPLDFNSTFGVTVDISYKNRRVSVTVGGHTVTFTGSRARFKFTGGGISGGGTFDSYLTDPSDMWIRMSDIHVDPCIYAPET